jgi:uncharacterized protein (DUF2236 family)
MNGLEPPGASHEAPPISPGIGPIGPGSQTWRINREAVLLGAGPASLLLQIAHPLVAEGVAAHSGYPTDPFGRLRRTLRTTLDLVFGDGPTADAAVRRLNGIHARVRGEVHDAEVVRATGAATYRALDPELLLWVQATLVITAVRAFSAWVGPVSAADRERFWLESRELGSRLGIPTTTGPATWAGLEAWFEAMIEPGGPIRVTPTARQLSRSIIRPPLPLLPGPAADLLVLPGLAFLPERLRAEFGIAWSPMKGSLADAAALGLKAWVRLVPAGWRAMPQARAAEHRTRSSPRPRTLRSPGPADRRGPVHVPRDPCVAVAPAGPVLG